MFRRILYSSLVDLSLPYGPGVNERGFVKDMLHWFGDDLHVVVPWPARGMPLEFASLGATHLPCGQSVRTTSGWALAGGAATILLPRAIDRFRPDLVVLRSGALAVAHFVTSTRIAVPYVLKTAGDVTFKSFYGRNPVRRATRAINDRMFDRLLHGALCIDVVSSSQRERALRLYPELESLIHVVDNGVDLLHFTPGGEAAARSRYGFDPDDYVVGYVGNLPMQRGGREVIDAVAGLRSELKVRGLIVGDSGEAESCRRYAAEKGVENAVHVFGEADYDIVPDLMSCLDVGLSVLREHERGNSEQKVRQYLAMGLCVVGTGGSNDFLRGVDFAHIVETEEPEPVVQAVASFAGLTTAERRVLGERARDLAESELSIASRNDDRLDLWKRLGAGALKR